MKKYIAPNSKYINLASEGSLMTNSNPDETVGLGEGTVEGANIDTRRQQSLWDNWSE